jgi:hypothetical protein
MPTTFAQRQTEAETLMRAGLGLVAIALQERDAILVKDPGYIQPGDTEPSVWKEHVGGTTLALYGVS